MAILIPQDISATAVPPGERKFHSFLKILFEPRPDVIGWHSVRVCGKEIDFALLLPGIGLFVFEVKDWKHENILVGHNVPEDRRARIIVKPFFDLCGDILVETVEQEGKLRSITTPSFPALVILTHQGTCLH